MKKIFKKNHIIITALALMIAVAGYINYADNIKEKNKKTETNNDIISNDVDPDDSSLVDPGKAVLTTNITSEFITSAKLDREQSRAVNKESLLSIINNETLTEDAKADAVASMVAISDRSEKETAAELLLEAKGFTNVIVSISDQQVDVVIEIDEFSDTQRAQVEDIVTRKTGCSIEKLLITTVTPVEKKDANIENNSEKNDEKETASTKETEDVKEKETLLQ